MTVRRSFMPIRPERLDERREAHHPGVMRGDNPWSSPDPLGEAFHFLRVEGTFYCRSELTEPWGLSLPAIDDCLWFHVVTHGAAWLEVEGAAPLALRPGDLTLVPRAQGHRVRSEPQAEVPDVTSLPHDYQSDRYAILRHGGGGASTTLICGAVRFDHPAARDLLALLPPVVAIESSRSPRTEWLQSTLRLVADEASTMRPGGEAVLTRLADIVVIQAIRSWIENRSCRTHRVAGGPAGSADRTGRLARPPVPRARLVRGLARVRARDVPLRLRRPLHRVGRRAGHELRHALPDARGPRLAADGGTGRR